MTDPQMPPERLKEIARRQAEVADTIARPWPADAFDNDSPGEQDPCPVHGELHYHEIHGERVLCTVQTQGGTDPTPRSLSEASQDMSAGSGSLLTPGRAR